LQEASSITFQLFDVLGRPIKSMNESRESPGIFQTILTPQDIPSGAYYYKARTGNSKTLTGKIIKCN